MKITKKTAKNIDVTVIIDYKLFQTCPTTLLQITTQTCFFLTKSNFLSRFSREEESEKSENGVEDARNNQVYDVEHCSSLQNYSESYVNKVFHTASISAM